MEVDELLGWLEARESLKLLIRYTLRCETSYEGLPRPLFAIGTVSYTLQYLTRLLRGDTQVCIVRPRGRCV